MFESPCSDGGEQKPTSIASEDVTNLTECDYDTNCTSLYLQIKNKNWSSVNQFLLTGYWSGGIFADRDPPAKQATTWVTKYCRKDKKKKVVWTQLPIHAALIYGAPEGVIKCLISISKSTLRCADDRRMLPLHLAFMHGSSDMTLGMVLDEFPEAVAVRDFKGRTPAECAEDGPNLKRGQIISTVLFYNKKSWEKKATKAQNEQLEAIQEALGNRNERISHLETALDLIKCREDQTRDSFSLVVSEIEKFKTWYEEKEADSDAPYGQPLDEDFVKNVALKLDYLQVYAEQLVVQQAQAREDSEKTLKDLNAIWGKNKNETDIPVRVFDDSAAKAAAISESKRRARVRKNKAKAMAEASAPTMAPVPQPATVTQGLGISTEQNHSEDVSSQTSLETGSTRKSKEVLPLISTHTHPLTAFGVRDEEKKGDTGSLVSLKGNEASLVSIMEASVESATNDANDKLPSIREVSKKGKASKIVAPSVMTKKVETPVVAQNERKVLTKKKSTPLFVPVTPVAKASKVETTKVDSLVSIMKKQEKSLAAPKPKLELSVTPKKKKVEKDDDSLTIPSEFRDDDAEAPETKIEEQVESDANRPVSTVSIPGTLSDDDLTSGDEDTIERELQMAISEMTSLDMSETTNTSKASSKITRMLSFGKKLNKITKKANKATAALSTSNTLPPKYSSSRSIKSNSGRVLSNPKRVAPTM